MGRLYPPIINGTIPAFCGTTLVVPFSINKAVSKAEIYRMAVKVKTVNGNLKETIITDRFDVLSDYSATFDLDIAQYSVGQYYKVQIAFVDKDGTVGHYSTVGVAKYTTRPKVSIERLTFGSINSHNYYYTGVYSQKGGDATEKMYSSRFRVYDSNGIVINDTGYILHNSTNDTHSYEATEEFKLIRDLDLETSFYIQFSAITSNGMEAHSPKYRIVQKRSVSPEIETELVATLNESNGFITLTFDTEEEVILGTFLISRASSKTGWVYEEFRRFNLQSILPESWSMLDCTIEHGVSYKYSLQQYNENGVYSERIESNVVQAKFDDAFLYDGQKQLCIKFNPKVSTFKTDLAEQKTETIGSKHPFIMRNGNVGYKEFSIGGLISYMMDESEQMFMTFDELGVTVPTTDLTYDNIVAERTFKMSVLDWLNDGNVKVFRSPAEGNYIVRLMNVSMTPQDTLGRMLHSFTATAYEMAEFTAANLEKYKLIDPTENLKEQTRWASVYLPDFLKEYSTTDAPTRIKLNGTRYAQSVQFVDMLPGSIIYLDDEAIVIGATGSYTASVANPFKVVEVDSRFIGQGMLTYSYKTKAISLFGTVMDITVEDVPCRQFIGTAYVSGVNNNLLNYIKDVRTEVLKLSMARFEKRPVTDVYIDVAPEDFKPLEEQYTLYTDMDCKNQIPYLEPLHLYHMRFKRGDYREFKGEGYYIDRHTARFAPYTNYVIDGNSKIVYNWSPSLFNVSIDGERVNLYEIEKYKITIPDEITEIVPSPGIISELGYSKQIITYTFDLKDDTVLGLKMKYLSLLVNYHAMKEREGTAEQVIESLRLGVHFAYTEYINALVKAIEDYKEAYGIE